MAKHLEELLTQKFHEARARSRANTRTDGRAASPAANLPSVQAREPSTMGPYCGVEPSGSKQNAAGGIGQLLPQHPPKALLRAETAA